MIGHWSLQQLRLFDAVARHGSFTRAANEVNLSQPAVHIQVRRMEKATGMLLIEMIGKRLYLTRAGETVHAAAREVLDRLQSLSDELNTVKGEVAGPLKVAVVTSAKFFMPEYLGRFLRDHPEVRPQLTVTNRARVLERLKDNLDDFVIIGHIPDNADWQIRPFLDNPLYFVAHPNHPLVGKCGITLERMARENLLIREPGSGTRAVTERLFAEQKLQIRPYMELGSSEAIKHAIMAELGVSILSANNIDLELETGRLAILDVQGFPLMRKWHAVHLRGKTLGLTAQSFLEAMLHGQPEVGDTP